MWNTGVLKADKTNMQVTGLFDLRARPLPSSAKYISQAPLPLAGWFLPLCVCVCVCTCVCARACSVTQSCPTLCNSMDCSPPGSSVHRISPARRLKWVAVSFSTGSFGPRDWTRVSCVSCIGRWILSLHPLGSPGFRLNWAKADRGWHGGLKRGARAPSQPQRVFSSRGCVSPTV